MGSHLAEDVSDVYRGCGLELSSTLVRRTHRTEINTNETDRHTFESSASFPAFGFLPASFLSAGFLSVVFLAIGPMGVGRLGCLRQHVTPSVERRRKFQPSDKNPAREPDRTVNTLPHHSAWTTSRPLN